MRPAATLWIGDIHGVPAYFSFVDTIGCDYWKALMMGPALPVIAMFYLVFVIPTGAIVLRAAVSLVNRVVGGKSQETLVEPPSESLSGNSRQRFCGQAALAR